MAEKKWQQAESAREKHAGTKGALHRDLGISEKRKIPTERLREEAKRLASKAKGTKKLSADDLKRSRRIQMALRYRGK
jgi:hypothetical protein